MYILVQKKKTNLFLQNLNQKLILLRPTKPEPLERGTCMGAHSAEVSPEDIIAQGHYSSITGEDHCLSLRLPLHSSLVRLQLKLGVHLCAPQFRTDRLLLERVQYRLQKC